MHDFTLLNDSQWENIQPLLPPRAGFGRPRADDRLVLEGILWVLRSGARWRDLPERYPSASTCWRRLRDWEEEEVWLNIWRLFLSELDAQGRLHWDEVFMDGSFAPAKKGGSAWVKPNVAKVPSGWWWQTALCIPLGSRLFSASPAEVILAEETLSAVQVPRVGCGRPRTRPQRLICDRAYDSQRFRERLAARGIQLICPHRRGRKVQLQDGRPLRRYRRRWKIERTFAHLGNFRRLLIRHERHLSLYQGFFHLACLILTLRHF